eukprot:5165627-Prymnesium_polylepis.2
MAPRPLTMVRCGCCGCVAACVGCAAPAVQRRRGGWVGWLAADQRNQEPGGWWDETTDVSGERDRELRGQHATTNQPTSSWSARKSELRPASV